MTREEILAVYEAGPEAVVALVQSLLQRLSTLEERVQTLESRLRQDSHNSSKPPSTDRRRQTRSLRSPSSRPAGGQPGHPGQTLAPVEDPDEVVEHRPAHCAHCRHPLLAAAPLLSWQRRQVFDLPPLRLFVREHRALTLLCPVCGEATSGEFPQEVRAPVQYGPQVQALFVYLLTHQLLPLERCRQLLQDLLGQAVSEATLLSCQEKAATQLQPVLLQIKEGLRQAPFVHLDETGFYIERVRQWLHSASTPTLTYYLPHRRRGGEALREMGVLPFLHGVAIHDAYPSYFVYAGRHALCNTHHLRELIYLWEEEHQGWARELAELLLSIKAAVQAAKAAGEKALSWREQREFWRQYGRLLAAGYAQERARGQPVHSDGPGRKKQSKAKNLLDRLRDRREAVLRFMSDFTIPFDNNQAERDLRMMKVQQKISGCFRSEEGATWFCAIRSYLSTVRKQGMSVMPALNALFQGRPFLPSLAT